MKAVTTDGQITTIAELRETLVDLVRERGMSYDAAARELRALGVDLGGELVGWRLEALCKGFSIQRRRGPRPSQARRVWREEVIPNIEHMDDTTLAEFYRSEVARAARSEKRTKTIAAATRRRPKKANRTYFASLDC